MLDITKRRIVTTRKEHECFGCLKVLDKGESAVCITAKEDEKHRRFHLHLECNKIIAKRKIDLQHGCIKGGVLFGTGKIAHWECRYCDNVFPPMLSDGDKVCGSCGAEWEAAKVLVEE